MMKQHFHGTGPQGDWTAVLARAGDLTDTEDLAKLGWLNWPAQEDDLPQIEEVAACYRDTCEHVVICGTGGSSLGASALHDLTSHPLGLPIPGRPTIHIASTTEPDILEALLNDLPPARTGWIFISRSGNTLETMVQFMAFLEKYDSAVTPCVTLITIPNGNPLQRMAEQHGIRIIPHPQELGGRFSVFSVVGMLPAAIMGLDVRAIRAGATRMRQQDGIATAARACAWHLACMEQGRSIHITMPYASRLRNYTFWLRQLWAESLGKDGQGSTPAIGLGPVDQHSVLQLYLDGPRDKSLTLIQVGRTEHFAEPKELSRGENFDYLAGVNGQDVINAQALGTRQSLLRHDIPVRSLTLPDLREESIGALLLFSILETVLTARMLEINAFDQPAVEEGKTLTLSYLRETFAEQQRKLA